MVKPNLRNKSIGTKVSEDEYAQLERAAQKSAKTLGEWCREVMLASANGQPAKLNGKGGEAYAVMAEVVALRAILLNVLFKQANGERLTPEEMQRLIDRADSDKLRKARERLEQTSNSKGS
ncbi:MAG TPA: hypothetical protein VNO32_58735 [Candidatus Acidoferrum sp.]|nr:hypothetical protein [Candidatus Acidoferrum sp.]